VGTTEYDAYGNRTNYTGTADSAIGYTGNWTDPTTGLVYLRARDYDPTTAQFLTVDPDVDQTRLPYAYTASNPLDHSDPTGLNCGGVVSTHTQTKKQSEAEAFWNGSHCVPGFTGCPNSSSTISPNAQGTPDEQRQLCIAGYTGCQGSQAGNLGTQLAAHAPTPIVCAGGGLSSGVAGIDGSACVVLFVSGPVYIKNAGEFGLGNGVLADGGSVPGASGLVGMGFTNATSEKQLLGPFTTTTVAGGIGPYGAGSQFSSSGDIWVEVVGWAPSFGPQATLTQGGSTTAPLLGNWNKPQ
jgi:RHS repeat-associated protein